MANFFEWDKKIDYLRKQIKSTGLTPFNFHESYLDEAVKCFHNYMPISCIIVSSASVEACLSWEQWRRRKKKVIPLETFSGFSLNSLINELLNTDIPFESLIDSDEDLEEIRKIPKEDEKRKEMIANIKYVKARNKLTHGDLFYQEILLQTLLPTSINELLDFGIKAEYQQHGSQGLRALAFVHLSKTLNFMKAFTEWV